ncbi:PH domain-containing protein [Cellulosimicrobium composti]|uniref:PH domain-containing protein n=1 Tax=Cellulosimicrobium composti TaxID=2672572 RepID=UPI0011789916
MSAATRAIGTIAVAIYGLIAFLTGLVDGDDVLAVVQVGVVACLMAFAVMLLAGGSIEAGPDGIRARNILFAEEWGWDDVLRIDSEMNVVVVGRDGTRRSLWAVQRAKAALMTGRRSRVDDVAEHLERCRVFYSAHGSGDQLPRRRGLVWLRAWEVAVAAVLVPALTTAGLLLGAP